MKGYIYIRNHISYTIDNVYKIGSTKNIPERDSIYVTGEVKRGYFEDVYEVQIEKMNIIERLIQNEFHELNIKYDGGTEFFDKKIINLIEPYFKYIGIQYKKLTKQEISDLVRCNRVRKTIQKINIKSLINALKSTKNYVWNERNYQKDIIEYSKNELLLFNKIYIELPTGGGKSYIVYNIFKYIRSDFIIIFSPRKIVNFQNISKKYLQILNDEYITFNYSIHNISKISNNFDTFLKLPNKKILICCTKSINKIYEVYYQII